jgi:hypothetical protein
LAQEKENDLPEIGTVFPLRSKYAEDFGLELVKKVGYTLETMGWINDFMQPIGYSAPLKIRIKDYENKFPFRKHGAYWVDGGKQLAVFQPDSFLPFFLNRSGSIICRLCNGNCSVKQIITRVKRKNVTPQEVLVEHVIKFLLLLAELDLIGFRERSKSESTTYCP